MADDLSLVSILQLAGFGGVVAAVANQTIKWGVDSFTENRKRKFDATYVAIRVSVILEAYVSACDTHIRNRDVAHDIQGISAAGDLPKLAEFPSNIDWRSCDSALATEVLGFPTRIEAAQSEAVRADWASNDYWVTHLEAVNLGVAAWDLAVRFRTRYRLAPNEMLTEVADALKKQKSKNDMRLVALREKWLADAEKGREAVRSGVVKPVNG
ncbi:hypothetical protein [Bosea sp. 685]|uniref:hypothetical protein n=1 Tax=Bosea sp. 685 TaxID=3080057 RepID=UPI002892E576|nr:hypothetical protein [Bosea sp. 685]WNJ89189.1 hypothetical protein RMR04_22625 [Bosea sp. 685]